MSKSSDYLTSLNLDSGFLIRLYAPCVFYASKGLNCLFFRILLYEKNLIRNTLETKRDKRSFAPLVCLIKLIRRIVLETEKSRIYQELLCKRIFSRFNVLTDVQHRRICFLSLGIFFQIKHLYQFMVHKALTFHV